MSTDQLQAKISILVVGYRMARQLANTLYTLSPDYQRNVSMSDYEVVIIENESDDNLPAETVRSLPANFRYYCRSETSSTPVPAINFGFQQCRAPFIGLMIDGARMLTPRVIEYALMASTMSLDSIVVVPGYHIGEQEQHLNSENYSTSDEIKLLDSIDWQENGYRLFDISTFSNANRRGYLQPMFECNCLFASFKNYQRIGFASEAFNLPGGGSLNLHMYRSIGLCPDSKLFVLPGEGSFHQFHSGVTTSNYKELQQTLDKYSQQLDSLWPEEGFQALRREPSLLGAVTQWSYPFLQKSTQLAVRRIKVLDKLERRDWPDDEYVQALSNTSTEKSE